MIQMSLRNIERACGGKLFFPNKGLPSQPAAVEDLPGRGTGKGAGTGTGTGVGTGAGAGTGIGTGAGAGAEINERTHIWSVVIDSRYVEQGALFLATKGERTDGHRFIASAYEKGAYCVITEKPPEQVQKEHGIPPGAWGAYILVEDTFQALKEIGEFYRSNLKLPIIGITGSVGKTGTKEFIAGVLGVRYNVLKTEGNFNNEIGLPLTLLRIRENHDVAVVEMGISDFGEMRRLGRMARPNICVFTNIGQSHLETLKSRDGILKAKTEIFEYMAADAEVCLNGDDDKLRTITDVRGKKPYFFGIGESPPKEAYGTDIVGRGLEGSDMVLHLKMGGDFQTFRVHVPLPGEHMAVNAAAAACVGKLLGLTPEQIREGIESVKPVGGRSNLIRLPRYTLIDDCYNANPISMKAAINLLGAADTLKVAILGDMFDLGEDSDSMHSEIGEYAAMAGLDTIICIGENARIMYGAAKEAGIPGQTVIHYGTKQDFFQDIKKNRMSLPDGGTILVKASHGMAFEEIIAYFEKVHR